MENTLQAILDEFVLTYPVKGQPAFLNLTVPTHDPNRDNSKFRLSDAGKCRLMRYYKRQGKKAESLAPDILLQMQAGNLIHAWIETAAYQIGCLISAEEQLEDDHRIGHFDLIIQRTAQSPRILYDVKTITSKKTYLMEKKGKKAEEQNIAQIVSYWSMLPYRSIDELRLAYVTRDTMAIREVRIYPEDHVQAVTEDWEILIDAWNAHREPKANAESWECRYCAYRSGCSAVV